MNFRELVVPYKSGEEARYGEIGDYGSVPRSHRVGSCGQSTAKLARTVFVRVG